MPPGDSHLLRIEASHFPGGGGVLLPVFCKGVLNNTQGYDFSAKPEEIDAR
jgi:hypothetical protein